MPRKVNPKLLNALIGVAGQDIDLAQLGLGDFTLRIWDKPPPEIQTIGGEEILIFGMRVTRNIDGAILVRPQEIQRLAIADLPNNASQQQWREYALAMIRGHIR